MKNIFQLKPVLSELRKCVDALNEGIVQAEKTLEPFIKAKERLEFFRKATADTGFEIRDLVSQTASNDFKREASKYLDVANEGAVSTVTVLLEACRKIIDADSFEEHSVALDRERFVRACESEINSRGESGIIFADCVDENGLNFEKLNIPIYVLDAFERMASPQRMSDFMDIRRRNVEFEKISEEDFSKVFEEYCHAMRKERRPIFIDDSEYGFVNFVKEARRRKSNEEIELTVRNAVDILKSEIDREREKMKAKNIDKDVVGVRPTEQSKDVKTPSEEYMGI